MGVDQILELDLSALTEESLALIDSQTGEIIDELKKAGKKPKGTQKKKLTEFEKQDEKTEKRLEKLQKQLEFESISSKSKKGIINKLFGDQASFKNIVQMGLNPKGFMGGLLTKGIPGFGAAVAATAIIVKILKKFDDLEKKFTDQINTKLRIDRTNESVARIQAGLDQQITTISPGIYDPRDSYNTFNEFNVDRSRIESDWQIRNTGGVE